MNERRRKVLQDISLNLNMEIFNFYRKMVPKTGPCVVVFLLRKGNVLGKLCFKEIPPETLHGTYLVSRAFLSS